MNREEILRKAINTYGEQPQVDVAIEELLGKPEEGILLLDPALECDKKVQKL